MPRSITTNVHPAVFKWLRESAGWSIEDVSKKLKSSVETVKAIESGVRDPTLNQLRTLSSAYKRPIAAFFLPQPQKEKPLPKDFRMLQNRTNVFDKKTLLVLRNARRLQKIYGELSSNIHDQTKPAIENATISDSPSEYAERYRSIFDLTEEKQRRFRDSRSLFNHLRDQMGEMNILVFQESLPVEDARGFALPDDIPNVIVLNSKDSIEARNFSIMHEFAHLLLGETAIDLPDITISNQSRIESWCNDFASAFLLPEELGRAQFESNRASLTETGSLKKLSRRFKISKGMLLFNMRKQGFISKPEYEAVLARYAQPISNVGEEKEEEKDSRTGGIPQDISCLSKVGNKFVSLVANNYDRNHITYTDALNYLSIKSRNFDKVLAKAKQ